MSATTEEETREIAAAAERARHVDAACEVFDWKREDELLLMFELGDRLAALPQTP